MEPPPSSTASPAAIVPTTNLGYPDSIDSSPRSRNTDSWDEPLPPVPGAKLRLMCSYGGHIVPRPHDKSLCYIGGETRIVVVDRHSSLSELSSRLSRNLLNDGSFTLKYQLPNEDLDSLISVTTDEDLENMIEEYDRTSTSSLKPSRLRLFLFPIKPESSSSMGSVLDDSKSETWFVDALNGSGLTPRGLSVSADSASVNCLLGLDDVVHVDSSSSALDVEVQPESLGTNIKQVKQGQDIHSVPDSPMLENSSSFGSASSSPSLSNLPPIRIHVEDGKGRLQDQKVGFEEHFSNMNIAISSAAAATVTAQKQDEGFVVLSSAHVLSNVRAINSTPVVSENPNRVFSDDERSDHGASGLYRKPPQPPSQQQVLQKPSGGIDLPSPDSVARDSSLSSVISRQSAVFYQEPIVQVASRDNRVSVNPNPPLDHHPKSNFSDPSYQIPMQQVQDSGCVLSSQLDHQQQQQVFQPGAHYIHHHGTGTGAVPTSYYSMYPPQQQNQYDQQYQMYLLPVRQNQPYNLSLQSPLGDTVSIPSNRPPIPPSSVMAAPSATPVFSTRISAPQKPELATNLYRNVPSDHQQQQFVSYHHQMHHPSQSIAANTAVNANYTYEFLDPSHAQIYYPQPQATSVPVQYQTMTMAAANVVSEVSTQENSKQQIRTSQPL